MSEPIYLTPDEQAILKARPCTESPDRITPLPWKLVEEDGGGYGLDSIPAGSADAIRDKLRAALAESEG